jgi:general secretion pathway protein I
LFRHEATTADGAGGFTLVEVLVSLAIFGLAAVVLGATYVNILTNYQAAMTRPQQQGELALLRPALLAEPDRARAEKGADQPLPGNRTARWQSRVEETAIADLFAVTFEWEIDEPGRPPATGQETFMLLRPTWSDPAVRERLRAASRQRLAKRGF